MVLLTKNLRIQKFEYYVSHHDIVVVLLKTMFESSIKVNQSDQI